MELSVFITQEQVERLIDDPETELVIYYPNGARVIVRITNDLTRSELGENETVH